MTALPNGVTYIPDHLERREQETLTDDIRKIVKQAPFFRPTMPRTGKPFSVRMTNCGELGWVADKDGGYRYQPTHPVSGIKWPKMPELLLKIWREYSNYDHPPQACLINYYDGDAKMGLHQDRDEQEFSAPVVSVSLGDTCLFRVGGNKRSDPTSSFKLKSGDVVILGGEGRHYFHGVDRLYQGTSTLLKNGGR